MAPKPSSMCVLALVIAFKLCFLYVVLSQSITLLISESYRSDVDIYGHPYKTILIFFIVLAGIGLLLDILILLAMFTMQFKLTKRLAICDIFLQCLIFIFLLTGVIAAAVHKTDEHVQPGWTRHFEDLRSQTNGSMSIVNEIQSELRCCGYRQPTDWVTEYSDGQKLIKSCQRDTCWWTNGNETMPVVFPQSCCQNQTSGCNYVNFNITEHPNERFTEGCFDAIHGYINRFSLGMAIILMVLALLTVPKNIWLYRFIEKKRRAARYECCVRFIKEVRHSAEELSRQANDHNMIKTSISGEQSERENLLASELPQLSIRESTRFPDDSKKGRKSRTTEVSTDVSVNNGSSSDRVLAGRCRSIIYEPEVLVNCEFEEDSTETWV